MNRNLLFIFTIIFGCSLWFAPSTVQARSANGYAPESVVIGGAFAGKEVIQPQKQYASRKHSRRHGPGYGYGYDPSRRHRRHYGYRSHRRYGPGYGYRGRPWRYGYRGYWRMERRYGPKYYNKVWNPGHYNRYGQWIPGHWVVIKDRPDY